MSLRVGEVWRMEEEGRSRKKEERKMVALGWTGTSDQWESTAWPCIPHVSIPIASQEDSTSRTDLSCERRILNISKNYYFNLCFLNFIGPIWIQALSQYDHQYNFFLTKKLSKIPKLLRNITGPRTQVFSLFISVSVCFDVSAYFP